MRQPPPPVVLVARTHWLVGAAIAVAIVVVHAITRGLPIAFSPKAYTLTAALSALFLATGVLVWLGIPAGQPLTRLCSLFYLIRPRLCFQLWDTMKTDEFRAHFTRRSPGART